MLATQLPLIFVQLQKISAKKAWEDPGLPNVLNLLQRCFKLTHCSALFTLGDEASLTESNNPKLNCLVKKCNGAIVILTYMLLKKTQFEGYHILKCISMTWFSCVLPKDARCKWVECPEKPTLFTADKTQPPTVVISECGAGALIQNDKTGTCWMFTILIRYSFFLQCWREVG